MKTENKLEAIARFLSLNEKALAAIQGGQDDCGKKKKKKKKKKRSETSVRKDVVSAKSSDTVKNDTFQ